MGKEGVRYLTWSVPLLHALMTLVDFVDMLDLEQVCLREERVQVLHVGVRGRGVLGRSPRQRLDGDGRGAEAVLLHLETYYGGFLDTWGCFLTFLSRHGDVSRVDGLRRLLFPRTRRGRYGDCWGQAVFDKLGFGVMEHEAR